MADSSVTKTSPFGAIDNASRISRQLHSLLCSLYGSGYESFSELNEDLQEGILWLASDMAGELNKLINGIALGKK